MSSVVLNESTQFKNIYTLDREKLHKYIRGQIYEPVKRCECARRLQANDTLHNQVFASDIEPILSIVECELTQHQGGNV